MGLGKMFSDPNMITKLAANPKTAKYLADPTFINKVCSSSFHSRSPFSVSACVWRRLGVGLEEEALDAR